MKLINGIIDAISILEARPDTKAQAEGVVRKYMQQYGQIQDPKSVHVVDCGVQISWASKRRTLIACFPCDETPYLYFDGEKKFRSHLIMGPRSLRCGIEWVIGLQ